MENELIDLLQRISGELLRNDWVLEEKWYDKIQETIKAYAAKQSQKDHLVELMKMDEEKYGEPCFTEDDLYYGKDDPSLDDRDILDYFNKKASQYATDRAKKLWIEPDVKEVFEYASLHALVAGFDLTIHQRGDAKRELGRLLAWKESAMKILSAVDDQAIGKLLGVPIGHSISENLLEKIREYGDMRAKKALEKVLSMLRENQAASSQLVPEDAARSAQDIINETFVDLIEIVQTFKP